jgi:hypothetical protein
MSDGGRTRHSRRTEMFAFMRATLSVFGITITPFCTFHDRSTCAGVALCVRAIRTTSSSSRSGDGSPGTGAPIGEYAVSTMPASLAYARRDTSGRHGCSSIWFVAGTTLTRASAASFWRSGTPKLETPIALTLPMSEMSGKSARGAEVRRTGLKQLLHRKPGVHNCRALLRLKGPPYGFDERCETTPGKERTVDLRLRPVHQVQVDVLAIERPERRLERGRDLVMLAVPPARIVSAVRISGEREAHSLVVMNISERGMPEARMARPTPSSLSAQSVSGTSERTRSKGHTVCGGGVEVSVPDLLIVSYLTYQRGWTADLECLLRHFIRALSSPGQVYETSARETSPKCSRERTC